MLINTSAVEWGVAGDGNDGPHAVSMERYMGMDILTRHYDSTMAWIRLRKQKKKGTIKKQRSVKNVLQRKRLSVWQAWAFCQMQI